MGGKAAQHHQKQAGARPAPDHGDGTDARREEAENTERKTREFDMDMHYGPCLGLTRAQRWASLHRRTRSAPPTNRASGRAASRV
ncbi:DNA polymerase delta subunit 4-like [Hordeum vulgare]|nr:DNA polymerase delta subunit 4-like [Hordeum vulgare]